MLKNNILINLKDNQYFEISRYYDKSNIFNVKGGRGCGKTYSVMKKALEDLFNYHRPVIYCRLMDTEFKAIIPIISEMYTPSEILVNCGIEFDETCQPKFIRGRPAKTITIKYVDSNKSTQYLLIALLCDIQNASNYKGYAPERGKEPIHFIFDEYTNGINMFTGDVEIKLLDLIETFYRTRPYKIYLLTNNNNENNAFKDTFNECFFIRVIKKRNGISNNKDFNDYIEGRDIDYDYKSLKLVDYYYITSRDIVGVYRHNKLDILLMKQESFEDKKHKAKKDKSIFDIECQFIDKWCENVFRMAKRNIIKLYE